MRRFTVSRMAAIASGIIVLLAGRNSVLAQSAPNYWAGDVALAPSAQDNLNQPAPTAKPVAAPPRASATWAQAPLQTDPSLTNQTRQALSFYGGRSAMATLNELPRSTAFQSASVPQPTRRPTKPFQTATDRPALSPYLNLFREEKASQGIPNYYAFVQPQLEQQAASQRQQIQSQRLQRRGQAPAPNDGGANGGAAQAGSSSSAHFMDTAQFYGAWRR